MAKEQFDINQQIAELLRRNRQLTRRVNVLFTCSFAATAFLALLFYGNGLKDVRTDSNGVARLRGLAIVDANGKTRVRLEAPLPEPVIMGVQRKRDDSVSGVMIYDPLGNERGGYVTDNSVGNAFLTLDSNIGQEVTLVAYPNGGAEFGINDDQRDKAVLSALKSGPLLRLVQSGKIIFEQPPVSRPKP
jgi:hypothetical protein